MANSTAKEHIIQSIQEGLSFAMFKKIEPVSWNKKEIFADSEISLIEIFQEELVKIKGEFFPCQNRIELIEKLRKIHSERNLGLCYSPDKKFNDVLEQAGIPYSIEFKNKEQIKSGISCCEFLIARFGSVMVSSAQAGARRIFSFPEIHIIIADEDQLVMEIEDGLDGVRKKYGDSIPSQITNICGPSRTADIEKTLILGAHGPKQFLVFVLNNDKL